MRPPPEVLDYYERFAEEERLGGHPLGELERLRTQELLARHLPLPPALVLDVGGAAGVHARALARAGHRVALIEPVERLARLARGSDGPALCLRGDARALPVREGAADAVLLLGPLYHLVERSERLRALHEARRALRPGGLVCVAGISRFASALDGLSRALIRDEAFVAIVREDLESGRHANPDAHPEWFTTAYLHRPEELAEELSLAGFEHAGTFAVEGPLWLFAGLGEEWAEPATREVALELLRRIEREPTLLGASAHLLAFGREPGGAPACP